MEVIAPISNSYRQGVEEKANRFREEKFSLHIMSGDNVVEENPQQAYTWATPLQSDQSPQSKLEYIKMLKDQHASRCVLMFRDVLNDAGALRQSDVGVAVSEHTSCSHLHVMPYLTAWLRLS